MNGYEKQIVVPRREVDHVTKLCFKGPDPGEIEPGSIPYKWNATFEDGCRIEVMVCADEKDPTGSPCWVHGHLLDSNGALMEEQDEDPERPWGHWTFFDDGQAYDLHLIPET